jgi:hypothetical protein
MSNNGTVIYRELGDPPQVLINWLDERGQLYNILDDANREHLYVDNEQPRDADITPMIVENTIGFSLFTEDGRRLSDYSRLDKALRAQEGAKLVIVPEVEMEEDIDLAPKGKETVSALEASLLARIAELEANQPQDAEDAEADEA